VYRKQTVENIKYAIENNAKQFVIYKAKKSETSYKEQIKAVRHYLMDNGIVFTEHEEQHYKYGLAHVFNLKKKE
jgi:hypothetical protein